MFPIKGKYTYGYKQGDRTFYGTTHKGVDLIIPSGTPIYMPKDGVIIGSYWGPQGGRRIELQIDGQKHRFLHLRRVLVEPGASKKGTIIAYSGNTGLFTTAPHTHWDIYDTKLVEWIDPLLVLWDNDSMNTDELKRTSDALGKEVKTFDEVLSAIGELTEENGRVTTERDHEAKQKEIALKARKEETELKIKCEKTLNAERDIPKLSEEIRLEVTTALINANTRIKEQIDKLI